MRYSTVGRLAVELIDSEVSGLTVGRVDPVTGDRIRVHFGTTPAYNGMCGRFSCAGYLHYYCRMQADQFGDLRSNMEGASEFMAFADEDELVENLVKNSFSTVRRATFEELALAVEPLIRDNPDWGAMALLHEDGAMHRFMIYHRYLNESRTVFEDGIDCWDLAAVGDPAETWRQKIPASWSPGRCALREEAAEQLALVLAPLVARLQGSVMTQEQDRELRRAAAAAARVPESLQMTSHRELVAV